ncbi:MAG TPA: hypothetical protein VK841_09370 [Polyangiaceae bacterium]|jgi:hypothetical protein|nr:hypothetical protein [Polyangiaceae bacterium]
MPNFSQLTAPTKQPRKAPRRVVLPVTAFADTRPDKPDASVAIGLRLISDDDVTYANAASDALAHKLYRCAQNEDELTSEEGFDQARNDALMRFCVARAACDVNDVTKDYFPFGEDQVRASLTSEAVSKIWDELVILHALNGLRLAPANDAQIERFARILLDTRATSALSAPNAHELRKLVAHCLAMLEATGHAQEMAGDSDGDEHGYRVTLAS